MFVACFAAACTNAALSHAPSGHTQPVPATLRVALFPYIPDAGRDQHASLVRYVKTEFEKRHPTIQLVIRPIDQSEDFYDFELVRRFLTAPGVEGYDLVEIDTVLLGDLVTAGLISPWPSSDGDRDWHPVAAGSVRINDAIYGIPHLLCGHFLITRNKAAAEARNIEELEKALDAGLQGQQRLVGNLLGSWNMPALFLDAWADARPGASAAHALHAPMDSEALSGLKRFSRLCRYNGKNPCLDGTYDDDKQPTLAADAFARGDAKAMFGYSERLFYVLSQATDHSAIRIAPAPMGRGNLPLLFTDAFVLRREAPPEVRVAARFFVDFMNSRSVHETILMSLDVAATATPRYLLPATMSAFEAPLVKRDRLYRDLKKAISRAAIFPNTGFSNTRKALRDAIKVLLESQ